MIGRLRVMLGVSLLVLLLAPIASFAGTIQGRITDPQGHALAGIPVSVQDTAGATAGQAVTDSDGAYAIHGLLPGTYNVVANGTSAVTYVGPDGATVNWGVSGSAAPVAFGHPGTTQAASNGIASAGTGNTTFTTLPPGCISLHDCTRSGKR
jgi:carboxypeptidase family protein